MLGYSDGHRTPSRMTSVMISLAVVSLLGLLPPALGGSTANAGTITYTCDPNVDSVVAGTCATLNTTIANLYDSTFTNANANIYIQYGTTGLGESTTGFENLVSYDQYRAALAATASNDAVDMGALASLPGGEPSLFSGGKIEVTSALGEALGLPGMIGTTATGSSCSIGAAGCYNGIITIATPDDLLASSGGTQTLFYRNGVQPADAYDYYTVVERETDEVLGTSSCVSTGGGGLSDGCGGAIASAADLFRYNAGNRVFENVTPGAYFSYDGGATNGAGGAIYNTLANSEDYAYFVSSCAHVQEATGCLGKSLDITSDGKSEIQILDAVGFNVVGGAGVAAAPEPATWAMMLMGLLGIGAVLRNARDRRLQAAA